MALDELSLFGVLSNLLALPNNLEQQAQQTAASRNMLQGYGATPEQLNAMAPMPSLTHFPGAGLPVLGQLLHGVGTVGQILQGALGTSPKAPRPEQYLPYIIQAQQAQRKAQLGKDIGPLLAEGKLGEAEAKLAEGGEPMGAIRLAETEASRKSREHESELNRQLRIDLANQAEERWRYTQNQREQDRNQPKNVNQLMQQRAEQLFPGDTARQLRWIETEQARFDHKKQQLKATGKANQYIERELLANHQITAQLRNARDKIAAILTRTPAGLATQKLSLMLERMKGDPDAIAVKQLMLFAPQLAKAHSLTSRFNQTEFNMYAGVLDGTQMTAQEFMAGIDNLLSSLAISEGQIRTMMPQQPGTQAPPTTTPTGDTPPSTESDSDAWHKKLDAYGVPR